MPILTFVARASDGNLLTASMEVAGAPGVNFDSYKQQAKMILSKLNHRSPPKCSFESGDYTFHYIIEDGVCYMTLCERNYDKRLSFGFLEDIKREFVAELTRDIGPNYRDKIDTVDHPYAFIKFDKVIQRKRREYQNPNSSKNMQRSNSELADITNIMRMNIEEVLSRGERLEKVGDNSRNLLRRSKEFEKNAKMLNFWKLVQKYMAAGACFVFVVLVLYLRFM